MKYTGNGDSGLVQVLKNMVRGRGLAVNEGLVKLFAKIGNRSKLRDECRHVRVRVRRLTEPDSRVEGDIAAKQPVERTERIPYLPSEKRLGSKFSKPAKTSLTVQNYCNQHIIE